MVSGGVITAVYFLQKALKVNTRASRAGVKEGVGEVREGRGESEMGEGGQEEERERAR